MEESGLAVSKHSLLQRQRYSPVRKPSVVEWLAVIISKMRTGVRNPEGITFLSASRPLVHDLILLANSTLLVRPHANPLCYVGREH